MMMVMAVLVLVMPLLLLLLMMMMHRSRPSWDRRAAAGTASTCSAETWGRRTAATPLTAPADTRATEHDAGEIVDNA